jgi:hypothetical protein
MEPAQAKHLSVAFTRNGAANVVALLLDNAAAKGKNSEEQVSDAMQCLEAMAEYQIDDACCVMIALWPRASHLMLHHVCDAIDLWICNNRSSKVIEYLREISLSESDPEICCHIEGLLRVGGNA